MLTNINIGLYLTAAMSSANIQKNTEQIIYVKEDLPITPSDIVKTISGNCRDFSFSIEYSLNRNTKSDKNFIFIKKDGKLLSEKINAELSNMLINRRINDIEVWQCRSFDKVNLLIFVSMNSPDIKSEKQEYKKISINEVSDSASSE